MTNSVEMPPREVARCARLRWALAELSLLALVLAAAAGLRWWREPMPSAFHGVAGMPDSNARSDPPSMDEVWHLALSTGRGSPYGTFPREVLLRDVPAWTSLRGAPPWWRIWTSLDGIAHPPLYLMTLRWWRMVFGEDDWTAIRYSEAWSLVAVVFLYLAARITLDRAVAFWAAAVLAVGPVPIYIALEIRGYSMLVGLAAIAIWWLARLQRDGATWPNVVGLWATLLASSLTHYFAAPAALGAGLYALTAAKHRWRRVLLGGLVVAAIYGVAWAPRWVRQLPVTIADTQGHIRPQPAPLQTVLEAASLPMRLIAEQPVDGPAAIIGAVALLLGGYAGWKRPGLRPFLAWGLGAGLFLLATDLIRHTRQLEVIRYGSLLMPVAATLGPGAIACLTRRRWPVHLVGAATIAFAMAFQPGLLRSEVATFTTAAQPVLPIVAPGQTLLVYFDNPNAIREEYTDGILLEWSRMPGIFPRDAAILYRPMSPGLRRSLRDKQVWLLTISGADPTAIVPHSRVVRRVGFWPTARSYYEQLRSPQPATNDAWLLDLEPLPP